MIEERRNLKIVGRRNSDGECIHHQEMTHCIENMKKQLDNTVARWIILGLVSLSALTTGYLAMKIEKHNDLITQISVAQASMLTNQAIMQEALKSTMEALNNIAKTQAINSHAIKKIEESGR